MHYARSVTFFLIAFLLGTKVSAQGNTPQSLSWLQYKGTAKFGKGPWGAMLDLQHRRTGFLSTTSQHVFRPGITYEINDQLLVAIGTALFWHNIDEVFSEPKYRFEVRHYQMLRLQHTISSLVLRHRLRFEQRFNRKTEQEIILDGFDFNYRSGYRLSLFTPLKKGIKLVTSNEILLNFGNRSLRTLDQNRVYIGIRYTLNAITYKTGYLWLVSSNGEDSNINHSHIWRIGINHRL